MNGGKYYVWDSILGVTGSLENENRQPDRKGQAVCFRYNLRSLFIIVLFNTNANELYELLSRPRASAV